MTASWGMMKRHRSRLGLLYRWRNPCRPEGLPGGAHEFREPDSVEFREHSPQLFTRYRHGLPLPDRYRKSFRFCPRCGLLRALPSDTDHGGGP